jgi:hypothetical protein
MSAKSVGPPEVQYQRTRERGELGMTRSGGGRKVGSAVDWALMIQGWRVTAYELDPTTFPNGAVLRPDVLCVQAASALHRVSLFVSD